MVIGYGGYHSPSNSYYTITGDYSFSIDFGSVAVANMVEAFYGLTSKKDDKVNDRVSEQRQITDALKAEVSRRRVEKGIADGLAAIASYGEDTYPNETVVSFRKTFASKPDQSFSYAAIKADGRWFVTGTRMNNCALTWDEFVLVLVSDVPATDFKVLTADVTAIAAAPADVPTPVVEYEAV